jgi:hypothetical protein
MKTIQRIKIWLSNYKEKRRRKEILKDIKKAKQYYLEGLSDCMCCCFDKVDRDKYYCCSCIRKIIPEYNPKTLGSNTIVNALWWPITDRESRIKAFDKLIEIYSK